MTRSTRDALIQKYLNGEMTSGEEGDFFIQVALDNELRLELKAQRAVESAMRKERESMLTSHSAMRQRVMDTLAASTVPAGTIDSVSAQGSNVVATALDLAVSTLRTTLNRWTLSLAMFTTVLGGSILLVPMFTPSSIVAPTEERPSDATVEDVGPVGEPVIEHGSDGALDRSAERAPQSPERNAGSGQVSSQTSQPTSQARSSRGHSQPPQAATVDRSRTSDGNAHSQQMQTPPPPVRPEPIAPAERVKVDSNKVGVTVKIEE